MAEVMHLQQVAMDARDGVHFCQSRAASGSGSVRQGGVISQMA
jgi:hypothetical protein